MIRCVTLLLAVLLSAAVADAKTPLRKCRKACRPLVEATCAPKGKALRTCRTTLVRACRREGVEVCALGLPTGGPDDGTITPTTTTIALPVTTTTTTTIQGPNVTTTTLPAVGTVAGTWGFEGGIVEDGCGFDPSYDVVVSALAVSQDGSALSGTMQGDVYAVLPQSGTGSPAAGEVYGGGWSFATFPDCRLTARGTCCLYFAVDAASVSSPSAALGTAAANCDDGFRCQSTWSGAVTRTD